MRQRLRRLFILGAIVVALLISVGGGGTYVAMEVTTRPKFCRSCHIMEPYYDSWAASSHKNVACVECHYEPGLLETFEGKFKALSQLAKYVTATQGTKPWAEVSDYSCMRSGCHSQRLLEGEINFGRIKFDHRQHLIGMERGKKLRCTSCHSQIVQGSHLTVTTSSCILCHFKQSSRTKPINDCNTCHGPPPEEIKVGDFTFRHGDYIARGVSCDSCHGDVTRGTGDVPRERCGSCHNKQAHLDRYGDVEFLHKNHVTDHSVNCIECHMEIQHGLPPREEHYRGDCSKCHEGAHGSSADIYRGTGGKDVADHPGVMYLARVTCNGCHRPPFPDAPVPPGGTTFEADPLACIDCHGTGFEGMAGRWQAETDTTVKKVRGAVDDLRSMMDEEWEEADPEEARRRYAAAAHNLGLVLLDKSRGVHNLPYVRDLLRQATADVGAGMHALDPSERGPSIPIGPFVESKEGCTNLCHVGIEEGGPTEAFGRTFPHARHLLKAKLDCSTCHLKEPHGTTKVRLQDCKTCHHKSDSPEHCGGCHTDVAAMRKAEPEGVEPSPMSDFDCLTCHVDLAEGTSREKMMQTCDDCHGEDEADFAQKHFDAWMASAAAPLDEVEAALAGAPAAAASEVKPRLEALRRTGPWHNPAFTKAEAAKLLAQLRG